MASVKDGSYCFLGLVHILHDKTKDPTGEREYYALLVTVKNGVAKPQVVFGGPTDDLNACVKRLKVHKTDGDTKRTFCGAVLTFDPPFSDIFFSHDQPCRLEALELRDLDKAQVYLGLI